MRSVQEPIDTIRYKSQMLTNSITDTLKTEGCPITGDIDKDVLLFGLAHPDIYKEVATHLQISGFIVKRKTVPFIIRDTELVDAALESRINGEVATADLKFPFPEMLIQVPRRSSMIEGSTVWYDAVALCLVNARIMNTDSEKAMSQGVPIMMIEMFDSAKSSDYFGVAGGTASLEKCVGVSDAGLRMNGEATGSLPDPSLMMLGIRLGLFLASMHADAEVVTRKKPQVSSPAIKAQFTQYREIKIKLTEVQARYQRDPDEESSGRQLTVRHMVRGHYKHYKEGKPIRWCPPHWRGPLGGPVQTKEYTVEA